MNDSSASRNVILALLVALTVVVLIGGVGWFARNHSQPAVAVTAAEQEQGVNVTTPIPSSTTSSLPNDEPVIVEAAGNANFSSLGWTAIAGPADALPPFGFLSDGEGGYVGYGDMGANGDGVVWRSSDALTWTSTREDKPSPGEQELAHIVDAFVPSAGDVDLNPEAHWGRSLSSGSATIIPLHLRLKIPWEDLYPWDGEYEEWSEDLIDWDEGAQRLSLTREDGTLAAELIITEDGDTAIVTDHATGEPKAVLTGSDLVPLSYLVRAAKDGQLRLGAMLVSPDGEKWEFMLSPWPGEDFGFGQPFQVIPTGGFIATVRSEGVFGEESLTTYLSEDGLTWTAHGTPPFLDGIPGYLDVDVYPFADRLRADVYLSEEYADISPWESQDGLNWNPAEVFEGGWIETHRTDFGWVGVTWLYEGGYGLWASEDGQGWQRLDPPEGFNELRIDGSWTAGAAGDVIYLSIAEEPGARHLWIGKFDN